jgi:hypothetical protein
MMAVECSIVAGAVDGALTGVSEGASELFVTAEFEVQAHFQSGKWRKL